MRERGFLEVVGALILLGLLLAVAAGAAVMANGTMRVELLSRQDGGVRVALPVPVNLVRLAMRAVPCDDLAEARAAIEPWLPAIRALVTELPRCPDVRLVELRSGPETITVVKEGRDLIVAVETPDERVRVSIPVARLGVLVGTLESPGADV